MPVQSVNYTPELEVSGLGQWKSGRWPTIAKQVVGRLQSHGPFLVCTTIDTETKPGFVHVQNPEDFWKNVYSPKQVVVQSGFLARKAGWITIPFFSERAGLFVNMEARCGQLTVTQLRSLLTGEVRYWSDLGGSKNLVRIFRLRPSERRRGGEFVTMLDRRFDLILQGIGLKFEDVDHRVERAATYVELSGLVRRNSGGVAIGLRAAPLFGLRPLSIDRHVFNAFGIDADYPLGYEVSVGFQASVEGAHAMASFFQEIRRREISDLRFWM
ncbi:hypothetical protein SAMN03159463_02344 [Mesorhizobium sp. NFR06]|uniref:hypothetical protein n=1 Tax=Mesorhizobium sp. NFR06 TaxID=1566290 RepID=UPI0008F0E726|nr:hypothetical protein [Mesorhizobium sp. NFR06]SFO58072.1 hypothetical protein SAMN03159463_02344 [Mesorhizobium sp. NFR06]